jgi:cytochrome c553
MRINRLFAFAVVAAIAATLVGPLRAQYDPIFDFIPLGGRSLLTKLFESKPPAADVRAILTAKKTRDAWVSELKSRARSNSALQRLSDHEILTLADYMSFNLPLAAGKLPADPARADWKKVLPMDGRDTALEYCQSCHIITVTVTQDRSKEAWLGTMNKPSHVGVKLTPQQREALASYLVLNAGIPIEQVPPDLRAGGATY